jgi:hypothetical protein
MQAAKEAMAKPEDDRNDCPDEDTSDKEERPATKTAPTYLVAKVTEEEEESNSEESYTDDIDVWTASRPTKPNPTTAATTLKLNSKTTSTRPGTREPTQDPVRDKTSNKSWHKKTNTDLAQEEDQTEKKPPDDTIENEEATENKAEWKDCLSDKPADRALQIMGELSSPPRRRTSLLMTMILSGRM